MEAQTKKGKYFKIFLFGLIILVLAVAMLVGVSEYKAFQEEKKAKAFIQKFIESIVLQTDFYKAYLEEHELDKYRDRISGHYEIKLIDCGLGHYEYHVLFAKSLKFYISFVFVDNEVHYFHFRALN